MRLTQLINASGAPPALDTFLTSFFLNVFLNGFLLSLKSVNQFYDIKFDFNYKIIFENFNLFLENIIIMNKLIGFFKGKGFKYLNGLKIQLTIRIINWTLK